MKTVLVGTAATYVERTEEKSSYRCLAGVDKLVSQGFYTASAPFARANRTPTEPRVQGATPAEGTSAVRDLSHEEQI